MGIAVAEMEIESEVMAKVCNKYVEPRCQQKQDGQLIIQNEIMTMFTVYRTLYYRIS